MTNSAKQLSTVQSKRTGRLLVLAAAVMWSTSGLFAVAPTFEKTWDESIRGTLLAFWRAAFASIALLPMVRRPHWTPRLIPMVLAFVAMNVTYLNAIAHADATSAIWLQNTAPVWVFLVGVYWFHEPAVRRDWILLLFCALGVGVILADKIRAAAPLGVTYGVLAGMTYACVVLSLRNLRDENSIWLIALNHLCTAMLLAPYVVYHGGWPIDSEQWFLLAGFGIFQMGIPYVLFARGIRSIAGHEASGIVLIEPVLVPIWVYFAWNRPPDPWTLVGGGLILSGLVARYVGSLGRRVPLPD